LAERGVRVLVAGLDMDFRGEPFGPMPMLMSKAERVDSFMPSAWFAERSFAHTKACQRKASAL